jgi:hypothetical protein
VEKIIAPRNSGDTEKIEIPFKVETIRVGEFVGWAKPPRGEQWIPKVGGGGFGDDVATKAAKQVTRGRAR